MAQTEQRKVITINDKTYFLDSFKDELGVALQQVQEVQIEKERTKVQLRNLEYAEQFLIDFLAKNSDKLEEVALEKEDSK